MGRGMGWSGRVGEIKGCERVGCILERDGLSNCFRVAPKSKKVQNDNKFFWDRVLKAFHCVKGVNKWQGFN